MAHPEYDGPPLDFTDCGARADGNQVTISSMWLGGGGIVAQLPDPASALAVARLFNLAAELRLGYDGVRDSVSIYGHTYGRRLLEQFPLIPVGSWVRVKAREPGGVIVLEQTLEGPPGD